MRILILRRCLAPLALALLLAVRPCLLDQAPAQAEDEASPPAVPAPGEAEGEAVERSGDAALDPDPGGGKEDGDETDPPSTEPEGVRRKRPRTEAEEREYKLRKTREDPYLNAPIFRPAGAGPTQFYNPADWIRVEVAPDSSRYLIQDAQGQPAGSLLIETRVENDTVLGSVVRVSMLRQGAQARRTEVWLDGKTLKPRRVVSLADAPLGQLYDLKGRPLSAAAQPVSDAGNTAPRQLRTTIDYQFDRVTILRDVAEEGLRTKETMRQLLFSFDREQLPLLVRQLDYRRPDWPFEAIVTVPLTRSNLQLQIAAPERVDLLSAEPEKYGCFRLTMRLGTETLSWWVERKAPNRLVRFTEAGLTYTLQSYQQGAPR